MAAGALPLLYYPLGQVQPDFGALEELEIHLFSKHLQFLDCRAAAEVAASLGFSGLDLTVRPGGHVEPHGVAEKLPEAIEAIENGGSHCSLITTAVENAENPVDVSLLKSASSSGISQYRTNWFRYRESVSMKQSLETCRKQLSGLSALNKELGLVGCYQNHAGKLIGASAWEVDAILANTDTDHFGVQYDIRHATVEGGLSWENGFRLLHKRIKCIVLKDFRWEKQQGRFIVVNTPIGEGMVDFTGFFKLIKANGIRVPAILHLEYPLGGAEEGARELSIDKGIVFSAMKKDLEQLRELWENA